MMQHDLRLLFCNFKAFQTTAVQKFKTACMNYAFWQLHSYCT